MGDKGEWRVKNLKKNGWHHLWTAPKEKVNQPLNWNIIFMKNQPTRKPQESILLAHFFLQITYWRQLRHTIFVFLPFFRETNFTKISYNWFHVKNSYIPSEKSCVNVTHFFLFLGHCEFETSLGRGLILCHRTHQFAIMKNFAYYLG